jgi:hypothetical protein
MEKFGRYCITSDKNFAIHSKINECLYINSNYDLHNSPLQKLINRKILRLQKRNVSLTKKMGGLDMPVTDENKNEIYFNSYRFFRKLKQTEDPNVNENDCLEFSEYLTTSIINEIDLEDEELQLLPYRYDAIVLRARDLDNKLPQKIKCINENNEIVSNDNTNKFGDCDRKNIYLAKNVKENYRNTNANPNEGESYAIVVAEELSKEEEEKLVEEIGEELHIIPYHIANVIYKTDNINITLEAAENPEIEYFQPTFSFYTITNDKYNFHNRFIKMYDEYNIERNKKQLQMNTIVLKTRDKKDIIDEIYNSPEYINSYGGNRKNKKPMKKQSKKLKEKSNRKTKRKN